jgi:RNA-directed DNA polymerase
MTETGFTGVPDADKTSKPAPRVAKLLKIQKGKCPHCGQYFTSDDLLEVDHITPISLGGKDEYKNLQLLHAHCHDVKSRYDGSAQGHQEEIPLW